MSRGIGGVIHRGNFTPSLATKGVEKNFNIKKPL
jgi:hypothetical protein